MAVDLSNATVTVRILSAFLLERTGELEVEAILPGGAQVRGVVPNNGDRAQLALSLAALAPRRVLNQLTGNVDVAERDWNAAVDAASAAPVDAAAAAASDAAASSEGDGTPDASAGGKSKK